MARRAFSSQCRVVTTLILLAVFAAIITCHFQSSASTSAKFRSGREVRDSSSAAVSDDIDFDYSGNASHRLVKRGMAPRCDVDTAFQSSARGCQYTSLMLGTQAEVVLQGIPNAVSKFALNDALGQKSGWKRTTEDTGVDPTTHAPYLIGLDNVEGFQTVNKITMKQAWVHSTFTQEKRYTRMINGAPRWQQPTFAVHEQISSGAPAAGVIIILNALDPKFMVGVRTGQTLPDEVLPEVGSWSDVGYLEYGRIAHFPTFKPDEALQGRPALGRSAPRWFIMPAVWGPLSSLSVVSHCLFGSGLLALPTWENRVTYPIGSFCFEAILGTPHGTPLASFLITHKYRLGDVALGSVTIYGSGVIGLDGYELPSMLWWAGTVRTKALTGKTLAEIRTENAAYSLLEGVDMNDMPHKLKPTY